MPCSGKKGEGCSTSCSGFTPRKADSRDITPRSKCNGCSHRKKSHNEATVQEVLAKWGLNKLGKKATTDAEARKESSAGFRPAGSASGSKKPTVPGPKKSAVDTPRTVKVGTVHAITCGLTSEDDLRVSQCPTGKPLEYAGKKKLAVFKMKTDDGGSKDLEFGLEWNQKRIDKWFRQLLPLLFSFLDSRYPENALPGKFHWFLLGKDNRTLYVIDREIITGAELDANKGQTARKYSEHAIRFATKHKIPSCLWKNLEGAVERLEALDGGPEPSESEEDDDEEEVAKPKSRAQPKAKGKGKARTKAPSPVVVDSSESEGDASSHDTESEEDELAAKAESDDGKSFPLSPSPQTYINDRLDLSIHGDGDYSDIEEVPRPDGVRSLGLKRSASPFGSFDPEASSKRQRSESRTGNSSSDDETVNDSPHFKLQPATSSFHAGTTPTSGTGSASTWTSTWIPGAITTAPSVSSTGSTVMQPIASAVASSSTLAPTASTYSGTGLTSSSWHPGRHTLTGHTLRKYYLPNEQFSKTLHKPSDTVLGTYQYLCCRRHLQENGTNDILRGCSRRWLYSAVYNGLAVVTVHCQFYLPHARYSADSSVGDSGSATSVGFAVVVADTCPRYRTDGPGSSLGYRCLTGSSPSTAKSGKVGQDPNVAIVAGPVVTTKKRQDLPQPHRTLTLQIGTPVQSHCRRRHGSPKLSISPGISAFYELVAADSKSTSKTG
ncbi:hypothetical protein C8R47DRAFT_1070889 [Mycena vitilis]|nr:hypothetical protein C8R47DRAFT_1070889 [Mycena vitilis]